MNETIQEDEGPAKRSWSQWLRLGALSWLMMLGIDFFLHGGLLAALYVQPSPFLLPAANAFRLIPLGYLSFLLLNVLLLWLTVRLGIGGWRSGFSFGLRLGLLTWGALVLGLLSISTADPRLLVGWLVGQSIELGAAGAVIGSGQGGTPLRRIASRVVLIVLGLVALTIFLQSLGLAPASRLAPSL